MTLELKKVKGGWKASTGTPLPRVLRRFRTFTFAGGGIGIRSAELTHRMVISLPFGAVNPKPANKLHFALTDLH